MTDAREEAAVDDDPGEECSARMVLRWAMQVLLRARVSSETSHRGRLILMPHTRARSSMASTRSFRRLLL